MINNSNITLFDRRSEVATKFLYKLESGGYKLSLNDYIAFNVHYNTRHKTIDAHHSLDCLNCIYFTRMRDWVNVSYANPYQKLTSLCS